MVCSCSSLVLEVAEGLEVGLFELRDPALVDLVERDGVEVVELLPALLDRGHETRGLEDFEVLGDALAGDGQVLAQRAERLAVVGVEPVEQAPAGRVREGLEDTRHRLVAVLRHAEIIGK